MILPEFVEGDTAAVVARKIKANPDLPYAIYKKIISPKVRVGAALYPRDGTTYQVLLKAADAAMYRSSIIKIPIETPARSTANIKIFLAPGFSCAALSNGIRLCVNKR